MLFRRPQQRAGRADDLDHGRGGDGQSHGRSRRLRAATTLGDSDGRGVDGHWLYRPYAGPSHRPARRVVRATLALGGQEVEWGNTVGRYVVARLRRGLI